jgi:thiamine kinase-like enzyme
VAADTAVLAIAARVWPGAAVTLEELSGGITNLNYKATTPSGTFVIRLFGRDSELLAIDRETEQAATSMAAGLGIGPEMVASAPREGYLVTRFLPGQPLTAEQMRAPGVMAQVAATLRVLHQGPPIPGTLDPFAVVDFYRDNAVARGADPGADYAWAKPIAGRIKRAVSFALTAPCHGDLLPANFLGYDGQIFLVDWEYAGMSDPRFDLANFSVNHDFGIDEDRELVRLYHGNPDEHVIAAVRLLRFMSAFREAMWSVVQQAISDLPFDFREYAREQFATMRAAASGQEFGAALALLESANGLAGSGHEPHAR